MNKMNNIWNTVSNELSNRLDNVKAKAGDQLNKMSDQLNNLVTQAYNPRDSTNDEKKEEEISWKERDPERYERNKSIIKKAIQDNDHEALEEMLQSRTRDFPDLIEMIEQALNESQKT